MVQKLKQKTKKKSRLAERGRLRLVLRPSLCPKFLLIKFFYSCIFILMQIPCQTETKAEQIVYFDKMKIYALLFHCIYLNTRTKVVFNIETKCKILKKNSKIV